MNKKQMVDNFTQKAGMTKADARNALDGVVDSISEQLKHGEQVSLPGCGIFTVGEKKPRTGRNPQTGAEINIPAARVPQFKPGKKLKEAVGSG